MGEAGEVGGGTCGAEVHAGSLSSPSASDKRSKRLLSRAGWA